MEQSYSNAGSEHTAEKEQAYRLKQAGEAEAFHTRERERYRAHSADQGKEGWERRLEEKEGHFRVPPELAQWVSKALPNTPPPQAASGKAAGAQQSQGRYTQEINEALRQQDATAKAGGKRMAAVDALTAEHDRKQKEEADKAAGDLKRFKSEHARRMALIQRLLDTPADGRDAEQARDRLVLTLWGDRQARGEDLASQDARRGNVEVARSRLHTAWEISKDLLAAQTAQGSQESFLKEAQEALRASAEPIGKVVYWAGKIAQWASMLTSLSAALKSVNDAVLANGGKGLPEEVLAVPDLVEDCVKASAFLGGIASTGAGAPAAAILGAGVVLGLGLEAFVVMTDLAALLSKGIPAAEPAKSIVDAIGKIRGLQDFVKQLAEIKEKNGEVIALGNKIRKFLHKGK